LKVERRSSLARLRHQQQQQQQICRTYCINFVFAEKRSKERIEIEKHNFIMKLLTANRQQTTTDNSVITAVDEQTTKQDGTVAHQPIGRLCGARKGKCQRGGNKAGGILQFTGSRSCNERDLLQSGVPKTVAESIMPLVLC
jgi:hypothetical protein